MLFYQEELDELLGPGSATSCGTALDVSDWEQSSEELAQSIMPGVFGDACGGMHPFFDDALASCEAALMFDQVCAPWPARPLVASWGRCGLPADTFGGLTAGAAELAARQLAACSSQQTQPGTAGQLKRPRHRPCHGECACQM